MRPWFWCGVTLLAVGCLLTRQEARAGGDEKRVRIAELRCEYRENPEGIDVTRPRLSWRLESDRRAQAQRAWRVLVASSPELLQRNQGDLWDSGRREGNQTSGIEYEGAKLTSRRACFWKVRIWDQDDRVSNWSPSARWSMGLLQRGDWSARWISHRDPTLLHQDRQKLYLPPPRLYRAEFQARPQPRRAMLYVSALGDYEARLNGKPVTDSRFTPGWSDYRRRTFYNAFNVTGLLRDGANALGFTLAEGWYSGYVGYGLLVGQGPYQSGRAFYGKTPALLAQLEVDYSDGSRQTVASSPGWKLTAEGPVREADILMGEEYDARRELRGWDEPGFPDAAWEPAVEATANGSVRAPFFDRRGRREMEFGFQEPPLFQAYPGVPVRAIEEVKPARVTSPAEGVWIFDLGQNLSGVARLKVKGPAGTRVRMRYGEMLHPDGRLMTENLRRARATDTYVLRGDPNGETWEPRFTYHGFQYVELTGYPGKPGTEAVTGVVLHSDTPLAGRFECSDPMVNRLHLNTLWTQRANFFEVPTDCPQRDERLGWMGDAQIYVRAATYNADVAAFFTKWLQDVEEAQLPNGAYPDYAPYPMYHGPTPEGYGTAWTDAGIICPWTIWQAYGDTRVIRRHWASMERFMQFRRQRAPSFQGVNSGNTWGDWLALGAPTPIEYIDAAYFALTADLMSQMAAAIGESAKAAEYRGLFRNIRSRFQTDYVRPGGMLTVDTQTAYALALWVGLFPESEAPAAARRLAGMVEANDGRMSVGFLGTRPIMLALTRYGQHETAVKLLQSRKFPSWGYEVENGATSIWERWNSYTRDKGFGDAGMNSFSHYAFGAVCEWMFEHLAGIGSEGPGFRKLVLRPGPPAASQGDPKPISWVRAEHRAITGVIRMEWSRGENEFRCHVVLPANTTATLHLPARAGEVVREGGKALERAEGVRLTRRSDTALELHLGSGSYDFTIARRP